MALHTDGLRLTLATAFLSAILCGQSLTSLREAAARQPPDFTPTRLWQNLTVRGIVAAEPIYLPEYTHVIIQDQTGAGLTLSVTPEQSPPLRPGAAIEATGRLEARAGLPMLRVSSLKHLGMSPPPEPQDLTTAELNDVTTPGRYITTDGYVHWVGQNAGGDVLALGNGLSSVLVFFPYSGIRRENAFQKYKEGDRLRVTGISAQYCPLPPFNRAYEIIINNPNAVTMISAGWILSPAMFTWVLVAAVAILLVWWWRERQLTRQRTLLREIMTTAEDVIAAPTLAEIARRIEAMPTEALGTPDVEIYLHSEASQSLERVVTDRTRTPLSIPLSIPIGSVQALTAVCFRNRALLAVPDLRRSPLIHKQNAMLPASAVIAPMLAQGQLMGVISMVYRRRADLNPDFQLAVQHLANQVAASLRLQDQQLMKEQLLRSEKMAAAGQLISGVAADLRVPLSNISRSSERLADHVDAGARGNLLEIGTEAQRGMDLIDHLVSFSNMEKREPRPVDIHALLLRILAMREEEERRKGIQIVHQIPATPVEVWADKGQIEQALLTVMVQAEHACTAPEDREIRISSRIVGTRVQIAFESSCIPGSNPAELLPADYFGFPVAQAILQSHGGDLRTSSPDRETSRLELELPVLAPAAAVADHARRSDKPGRVLTAIVVDPDVLGQRRVVSLMAARGHRAIPVSTSEAAAEMVQRMQFDIMFCATRIPGQTWIDLFQRVRRRVGVFALMTEGFEPEATHAFANGEGHLLPKPIEERDLEHVLGIADVRWAVSRR